jgi:hypothetical protein
MMGRPRLWSAVGEPPLIQRGNFIEALGCYEQQVCVAGPPDFGLPIDIATGDVAGYLTRRVRVPVHRG